FRPAKEFKKDMDTWIKRFRSAETIPGEKRVYIPGDIEREYTATRLKEGIPLMSEVVRDLQKLALKYAIIL
ncbi:MAG: Ldh family oxidoreductase, partial [Chitinophagaceae bacterium]